MLTEQKHETVVNFYAYNGSSMIWIYDMMVPVIFQLQSRITFNNEMKFCNHFICKEHFGRTSREMLSLTAIFYQFKTFPFKIYIAKGRLYSDYYSCPARFELCKSQFGVLNIMQGRIVLQIVPSNTIDRHMQIEMRPLR